MVYYPNLSRQSWPHDPDGLDAYYGDPRGIGSNANPSWEANNLVDFTFPWKIKSGGQTGRIHKLVKPSLYRILGAIWDYLDHDQTKISYYHLDEFGGTYVFRQNRNNPAALSNHARGIAIDLAPDENPNRSAWVDQAPPHLPRFVVEAFKQEGWRWGGDYKTTKDAMHFEAVFNDETVTQAPIPQPSDPQSANIPTIATGPGILFVPPAPTGLPPLAQLGAAALPLIQEWLLDVTGVNPGIAKLRHQAAMIRDQAAAFVAALDAFSGATGSVTQPKPPIAQVPPAAPPLGLPLGPLPPFPAPQPPQAPAAPAVHKFTNIHATCFGGSLDRNTSAYDGHVINDSELGVSLPARLAKPLPKVVVELGGKTVTCSIVDVGPWNTNDAYWTTGARPQAESGTDRTGRRTNLAGIDLTPGTVIALGVVANARAASNWSGIVNWWFASENQSQQSSQRGTSPMSMPSDVGQVFAGSKKWYQSSGIWGAIIAAISPALGGVLHVSLSSDQAGQLAQALAEVGNVIQVAGPVLGGIVAGIGRVKANTTIGG